MIEQNYNDTFKTEIELQDKEFFDSQLTIKLVDCIPGSGKSTAIIDYMRANPSKKYLYISPLLSETGGEREELEDGTLGEPQEGRIQKALPEMRFKFPLNKGSGKLSNVMDLIINGDNISTTHQCFSGMGFEEVNLLRECGYTLIIDESMEAISPYSMHNDMRKILNKADVFHVHPQTGRIFWNYVEYPVSSLEDSMLKELERTASKHALYLVDGKVFIEEFPLEVIKSFDEVIVMTYLFQGTIMKHWCDIHKVNVVNITESLNLYRTEAEVKEKARQLINLYEPKVEIRFGLSQSWWKSAKDDQVKKVKTATETFCTGLRKKHKIKPDDLLVCCPKDKWSAYKGKGYSRAQWLASSCRATNDYADKKAMIYALAKHPNPSIEKHVYHYGSTFNRSDYALSEMIQWIWRSAIRKGEPIHLYIIEPKMRKIFKDWLNS